MKKRSFLKNIVTWMVMMLAWQVAAAQSTDRDQLIRSALDEQGMVHEYVLTSQQPSDVRYVILAMPGGAGAVQAHMQDGHLVFQLASNFLLRSRDLFIDSETVFAFSDATRNPERVSAMFKDLKSRYPKAQQYLITTSKSTLAAMLLAPVLDGEISGFIYTSSFDSIASFDTRSFKSRQLIVHHVHDACRFTPWSAAKRNHDVFGTDFIEVQGGQSQGDDCQSWSYHGFNGVESDTINRIKAWMKMPK